jgi:hypothetical protein
MTQFDFGDINPDTVTGTALTELLENHRDAMHSSHAGAAAPSYVTDGMVWLDTSDSIYRLKLRFLNVDTILAEFVPGAANASPALELADESEAQTGTNNTKLMTPLRVNQHFLAAIQNVDLESLGYPPFAVDNANAFARFSSDGLSLEPVLLAASAFHDVASQAEAENGTATNRSMTPLRVAQAIAALAPAAAPVSQVNGQKGDVMLTKADVGLGNVPNIDPASLGGAPRIQVFESSGTWTKPAGLKGIEVTVIGGGGGAHAHQATQTGGTSSFGVTASAVGGVGTDGGVPGVGGIASGGDININGMRGVDSVGGGQSSLYSQYGAGGFTGAGDAGGGGATVIVVEAASNVPNSVTVTVGAGGDSNDSSGIGNPGAVIVKEYY